MSMFPDSLSRTGHSLLVIVLIFIILIAVKMTSYIVTLFLMSLILTFLLAPAMLWLKGKGLPNFPATIVVSVFAGLVILSVVVMTVLSFQTLLSDIPQFQTELNARLADIYSIFTSLGILSGMNGVPSINLGDLLSMGVGGATRLIEGGMFLFFVGATTFFILLETPNVVDRMEQKFGKESDMIQQLNRMTGYIIDFIVVRTETNFVHAVLFGGFLSVMGVHGAILWGVLTFILGYIPFFGLVIAAIPAIFFAWLQFGIPGAVAVIVAVCVLNLIVENPVYSYLAARKFDMPALIVILSVIFWGWLLGLVGMLFAVPMTLFVLLVLQMSEDFRWINAILGVNHLFEEIRGKGR